MERIERYRGSLLGLAVGDALGTTLEVKFPESFEPINTGAEAESGIWDSDPGQ